METHLELEATVTSKGQITLPAALRAKLGLTEGSRVKFIHDGRQTLLQVQQPPGAYFGILQTLGAIDTDIPKEPDRFG